MIKGKVFNIPFLGYKTHCIVYGDIFKTTPIIVLHGGPGGCVERYEALTLLMDKGIPLIFYDQLGSGYSKIDKGHFELMNFETFEDELENVVKYFHLNKVHILGHSWGGMLILHYLTTRKCNFIDKLILFSTLPSTKIWNEEHLEMIKSFPEQFKVAIENEYFGKEYDKSIHKKAVKYFYDVHVGKKSERKYINKRKRFPKTNKEIYNYMWGPSELFGTGTLKDYDVTEKLHLINIPTLIISGAFDESSPKMNEIMKQKIPNSRWVILDKSHHGGYVEQPDETIKAISEFILD